MKTKLLLLSLLFVLPTSLIAEEKDGGIFIVSAEYTYKSDDKNEALAVAEIKAKERARLDALEKQFGIDVQNATSTVIRTQSNSEASTETKFYSVGESVVKGEWIETISESVSKPTYQDGFLVITAKVKGKARAKSGSNIQIESKILRNGTDEKLNAGLKFRNGDQMFVKFTTPVEGFVCIYLIDEDDMAYCLLPYQYNSKGSYQVRANYEYIFFSYDNAQNSEQVDEYMLTTRKSTEFNQVWTIFSPNSFSKAVDDYSEHNWLDQPVPRSLTYSELVSWLSENRLNDKDMVIKRDLVTIVR